MNTQEAETDNLPVELFDSEGNFIPQVYEDTPKGIPLQRLIDLRAKGLSYYDIGKIVGCTKSNVHKRLKPLADEIENLPSFKKHRADYFAIK